MEAKRWNTDPSGSPRDLLPADTNGPLWTEDYAAFTIYNIRFSCSQPVKVHFVLRYGKRSFNSWDVDTPLAPTTTWSNQKMIFKANENETKFACLTLEIHAKSKKLGHDYKLLGEASVPFSVMLFNHVRAKERSEMEKSCALVTVSKKGKDKGKAYINGEVTGWRPLIDLLSDDDPRIQRIGLANFYTLLITKNAKLNLYLNYSVFESLAVHARKFFEKQKVKRKIERTIAGRSLLSSRSDELETSSHLLSPRTHVEKDKIDIIIIWKQIVDMDGTIKNQLIKSDIMKIFLSMLEDSIVELNSTFLELLKPFFISPSHQEAMVESGILGKLVNNITHQDVNISSKTFDLLMYFDVVHHPKMLEYGFIKNAVEVLTTYGVPTLQIKVLEMISSLLGNQSTDILKDELISNALVHLIKQQTLLDFNGVDPIHKNLVLKELSFMTILYEKGNIKKKDKFIKNILVFLKSNDSKIQACTSELLERLGKNDIADLVSCGYIEILIQLLDTSKDYTNPQLALAKISLLQDNYQKNIIEAGFLQSLKPLFHSNVFQSLAFESLRKFNVSAQELIEFGFVQELKLLLSYQSTNQDVVLKILNLLEMIVAYDVTVFFHTSNKDAQQNREPILVLFNDYNRIPLSLHLSEDIKTPEALISPLIPQSRKTTLSTLFSELMHLIYSHHVPFSVKERCFSILNIINDNYSTFLLTDNLLEELFHFSLDQLPSGTAEEKSNFAKSQLMAISLICKIEEWEAYLLKLSLFPFLFCLIGSPVDEISNLGSKLMQVFRSKDQPLSVLMSQGLIYFIYLVLHKLIHQQIKATHNLVTSVFQFLYDTKDFQNEIIEQGVLPLIIRATDCESLQNTQKSKIMTFLLAFDTEFYSHIIQSEGLFMLVSVLLKEKEQALLKSTFNVLDTLIRGYIKSIVINENWLSKLFIVVHQNKPWVSVKSLVLIEYIANIQPVAFMENGGFKNLVLFIYLCKDDILVARGLKAIENLEGFEEGLLKYGSSSHFLSLLEQDHQLKISSVLEMIIKFKESTIRMLCDVGLIETMLRILVKITNDNVQNKVLRLLRKLLDYRCTPYFIKNISTQEIDQPRQSLNAYSYLTSNTLNETHQILVNQWLSLPTTQKWKRLYATQKDGWQIDRFYEKCMWQSPLLFVFTSSNGSIFGAYSTSKVSRFNHGYQADKDAFLFNFKSTHRAAHYPIVNVANAICVSSNPPSITFGNPPDLIVYWNEDSFPIDNPGVSYTVDAEKGVFHPNFFTGDPWAMVSSIEIFTVPSTFEITPISPHLPPTVPSPTSPPLPIQKPTTLLKVHYSTYINRWAYFKANQKWKQIFFHQFIKTDPNKPNEDNWRDHCTGNTPRIFLVKLRNKAVFGGFTSADWSKDKIGFQNDPTAFLFSLKRANGENHVQYFPVKNNGENAILNELSSGPIFGKGLDLSLDLNKKSYCFSNLGFSYETKSPFMAGKMLTDSPTDWDVEEISIYKFHKKKMPPKFVVHGILNRILRLLSYESVTLQRKVKEIISTLALDCLIQIKYEAKQILAEGSSFELAQNLRMLLFEIQHRGHCIVPFSLIDIPKNTSPRKFVFKYNGPEPLLYITHILISPILESSNLIKGELGKAVVFGSRDSELKLNVDGRGAPIDDSVFYDEVVDENIVVEKKHISTYKKDEHYNFDKPLAYFIIPSEGFGEKSLEFGIRMRYIQIVFYPKNPAIKLNLDVKIIGYNPAENNLEAPPTPKLITNINKKIGLLDTKPETIKFKYTSDFDTNGLIYWIGCNEGKSTLWTNPADEATGPIIKLTTSHKMYNSTMKVHNIIDRVPEVTYFGGTSPQFFRVDLVKYIIRVSCFTLRHGYNYPNSYIQDFVFSGIFELPLHLHFKASTDGVNWDQLYSSYPPVFNRGYDVVSIPLKGQNKYYRYFELLQRGTYSMGKSTSKNSAAGAPYLCLCGFELYGEVKIIGN